MDVAKRVKTIRRDKGISVYKLAKLSGVSSTYLYEVEQGKKQPTVDIISRICDALEVSLAYFFAENDEKIALQPVTYKLVEKIATLSEDSIKYLEEQAELLRIKESLDKSND